MSLLTELGKFCRTIFYKYAASTALKTAENQFDTQAHDCYFVGMSAQRIHLLLSKESLSFGRQLARKKKTSISRLVEGFFLGGRNHVRSDKPFSERWAGKVALRTPEKSDRRGVHLAKKYS